MRESRQLCTFLVDDLHLGIDVTDVQEVIRFQQMTAVPLAPEVVLGLINLRGQIVTVLDLRAMLGLPALQGDDLPTNVVIRGGQDEAVSVLVDSLSDVVDTDVIRRVDGRRTVTLNAVPPRSVALETAVQRVEEQLPPALQSEELVPAGMSVEASGAVDQLGATRELLSGNFAIATLLSYLLLVAIFTHWGWPLMILASVPLGLAGGKLG